MQIAKDSKDGLSLFIPFTKVEEEDDGTVIVEGIATAEVLDSQGDVVMYDASVKAFGEWGDYFHKVTDGDSVGNIREMHDEKIAAGKAVAWWPVPDKKQIGIRTKAVDPGSCKKIREKVLTGFSIAAPGHTVARQTVDWEGKKATAITNYQLGEVSYVDRGACPDAVFTLVKREVPKPGDPVTKGYAEALAAAQTAEDAMRVFISEMALLEGDASTWSLRMMTEALATVCGAKRDVAIDATDQTMEAADAPAAEPEPESDDGDEAEPVAAAANPDTKKTDAASSALVKLMKTQQEQLLKAVTGTVDAAKSELTKRLDGLDERIKVVESTPAEPGSPANPVKKRLGADDKGGSPEVTVEQLEAGVVELEKAGGLDPMQRLALRKALGAAKLSRESRQ